MIKNFNNYIDQCCPFCGRLLKTASAYTLHVNQCKENLQTEQYKRAREEHICPKCGKKFKGTTKYCSRSCANSHKVTQQHREKVSKSINNYNMMRRYNT